MNTPRLIIWARFLVVVCGWVNLLPITAYWIRYRNRIAEGVYGKYPAQSFVDFLPVGFLIGLSLLAFLIVRTFRPRKSSREMFFWISLSPLAAEVLADSIG